MDINEEKVRLEQHCKYFIEQVENPKVSAGRTLGFLSQEMGREINTLGAKAYDADVQRLIVQMKDELEKIKEQLANILWGRKGFRFSVILQPFVPQNVPLAVFLC